MGSLIAWTFLSSGCVFLADLQPTGQGTQPGGVALFLNTAARTTKPR
jgi:hypothetical protein